MLLPAKKQDRTARVTVARVTVSSASSPVRTQRLCDHTQTRGQAHSDQPKGQSTSEGRDSRETRAHVLALRPRKLSTFVSDGCARPARQTGVSWLPAGSWLPGLSWGSWLTSDTWNRDRHPAMKEPLSRPRGRCSHSRCR